MELFKRKGFFFIPVSAFGRLILGVSIIYAIYLFIDIDSRSHSVSDTLMNWVFNCLIIGIAYSAIGAITQVKQKRQN